MGQVRYWAQGQSRIKVKVKVNVEFFPHLLPYKLSDCITQLWYKLGKLILSMYVHLIMIRYEFQSCLSDF